MPCVACVCIALTWSLSHPFSTLKVTELLVHALNHFRSSKSSSPAKASQKEERVMALNKEINRLKQEASSMRTNKVETTVKAFL